MRPTINHKTGGTVADKINTNTGRSAFDQPKIAYANAIGTEPQTKAATNRPNDIRAMPAKHAMASGNSGIHRDRATAQPPAFLKNRSPRSRSFSPAIHTAAGRPMDRDSP